MRDEVSILCDKIIQKMSHVVSSDALAILSDILVKEFFHYDVCVKPTQLVTLEDADVELLKRFICMKRLDGLTDKTLQQYYQTNLNLIQDIHIPLREMKTNDIKYYLAIKTCSDTTKNNYIRYINSFFKWLDEEGIIPENPCRRIHTIKTERKVKKSLNSSEIERLKRAASTTRDRALLTFLYSTGCRVGEVVNLNRNSIQNGECIVYGKGRKERSVFLDEVSTMYLNRYLSERKDNNEALFVSGRAPHDRLTICGIESIIGKIGQTAGIYVHPHMLRRTLATTLSNRNCSIQDIQMILGHTDIETTMLYINSNKEKAKSCHKLYV